MEKAEQREISSTIKEVAVSRRKGLCDGIPATLADRRGELKGGRWGWRLV